MTTPAAPWRWDLFCSVIDNFGDAGVAWRLARLLAREHGATVRLWIDQPARLAPLLGRAIEASDVIDGITVAASDRWRSDDALPHVIVEVLGCGVPEACHARLRDTRTSPAWFILEYLTAEPWADDLHGRPSPEPRTGLPRRFWFPGFTARTGGLLREDALLDTRGAWHADATAGATLMRELGGVDEGRISVSLFCYREAPVAALLDAFAAGDEAVQCLVPQGVASEAIAAWSGVTRDDRAITRGSLRVVPVPFLPQARYDTLLWSCAVNFVRGEDSFVRAQWAARPFVWNVYPQADAAHAVKLDAFLDRFTAGLAPPAARATRDLWRAWNGLLPAAQLGRAWQEFRAADDAVGAHGRDWCAHLATLPELATTLAAAARDTV